MKIKIFFFGSCYMNLIYNIIDLKKRRRIVMVIKNDPIVNR